MTGDGGKTMEEGKKGRVSKGPPTQTPTARLASTRGLHNGC